MTLIYRFYKILQGFVWYIMMSSNIFLALLMILPKLAIFFYQKTPKFSKNVKKKLVKKGSILRGSSKGRRNMLDDIIMYQTNPYRVL